MCRQNRRRIQIRPVRVSSTKHWWIFWVLLQQMGRSAVCGLGCDGNLTFYCLDFVVLRLCCPDSPRRCIRCSHWPPGCRRAPSAARPWTAVWRTEPRATSLCYRGIRTQSTSSGLQGSCPYCSDTHRLRMSEVRNNLSKIQHIKHASCLHCVSLDWIWIFLKTRDSMWNHKEGSWGLLEEDFLIVISKCALCNQTSLFSCCHRTPAAYILTTCSDITCQVSSAVKTAL